MRGTKNVKGWRNRQEQIKNVKDERNKKCERREEQIKMRRGSECERIEEQMKKYEGGEEQKI